VLLAVPVYASAVECTDYRNVFKEVTSPCSPTRHRCCCWTGAHRPTRPLLAAAHAVLESRSASQQTVYDIRYPSFVPADPRWTGPAFHDPSGGRALDGYLLKDRVEWSGMVFCYDAYLYDARDPDAVVEIEHFTTCGGPDDYFGASLVYGDEMRVLVEISGTYADS
jgi:hypothetical protein